MTLLDGISPDPDANLATRAAASGFTLQPLDDADRVALPAWARIAWVAEHGCFALWDVRSGADLHTYNALAGGQAKVRFRPDDAVVDVGAYVGAFTIAAARHHGVRVRAYEPSPTAWAVLRRNAALFPRVEAVQAAVTADGVGRVMLNVATDGPGTSNSLVTSPRRARRIQVATVAYARAVRGATVIKIDVEGAEFGLPITPVAPDVRVMLISWHLGAKKHWLAAAERMRAALLADGFRPVVDVDFASGSVFRHEGVYERR